MRKGLPLPWWAEDKQTTREPNWFGPLGVSTWALNFPSGPEYTYALSVHRPLTGKNGSLHSACTVPPGPGLRPQSQAPSQTLGAECALCPAKCHDHVGESWWWSNSHPALKPFGMTLRYGSAQWKRHISVERMFVCIEVNLTIKDIFAVSAEACRLALIRQKLSFLVKRRSYRSFAHP